METIDVDVRIEWLQQDPDYGECVSLALADGDPNQVAHAHQALGAALEGHSICDYSQGVYRITLLGFLDLHVPARQWPALAASIADLDHSLAQHWQRQQQWLKRRQQQHQQERPKWARNTGSQSGAPGKVRVPPADVTAAFKLLHVVPDSPPGLIGAARRFWLSTAHPDKPGGDLKLAQRLNAAADLAQAWTRAARSNKQ